jgi:hypothetical protein
LVLAPLLGDHPTSEPGMPMNTVSILRGLWGKRRLVACVAVVAVLVGYAIGVGMSFPPNVKGKKPTGVASVRLLVDTPSSQVVNVDPVGLDLLTARANLLASLMVNGVLKGTIAERAGLQPNQLSGADPGVGVPSGQGATAARQTPYVLTTNVLNDNSAGPDSNPLPIIVVGTQAPTAAGAANLANAAVAGLQDYIASLASTQNVPQSRRLRVTSLGAPNATEVAQGPKIALGLGLTLLIFLAGCALILWITALIREWRATSEEPVPLSLLERRPPLSALPQPRDPVGDREGESYPREADSSRG